MINEKLQRNFETLEILEKERAEIENKIEKEIERIIAEAEAKKNA